MPAPLAGIRVLDLTSVVVGPTCTLLMAQQGADVIKLEPPEGDLLRKLGGASRTPGMSPKFLHFNRGKRSITVDLKTEAGRGVARRIASGVDVFVSNIRGAALRRLGLAWEDLAPENPRLVHCAITGFGSTGRYADLPAYDTIIQGASGMASAMARTFDEPRYMPFVAADHMTGFLAAQAICAALVGRAATGQGQAIEVPMFENMASFVLTEHMYQRTYGPEGAMGDPRIMDKSGRPVRTRDGWICVSPNTDAQAFAFFEAIGRPELKHDPRFHSVAARLRHVPEYFQVRAEGLATRPTAEWLDILRAKQVPAMQVTAMEDLFDDPHLRDVGLIETQTHHSEGEVLALRPASRFSSGAAPLRDTPRQGEDGRDILREFGFSDAEIADLMTGPVRPTEPLP
jgi:crotonobetainyl-CoA:carnitine CoA-transferase CaiB-like acyl-CoA transferase